MNCIADQRARAIGASFESPQLVFDLQKDNAVLLNAIERQTEQFLPTYKWLHERIPIPRTSVLNVQGHFYRLPGHNRSFCYSLAEQDFFLDGPVIVFKGMEPLLADFDSQLDWMSQAPLRKSGRVMTDHFPLAEGKIPGALSLQEALHEASIALDIQSNHLKYYGELARIPVPLLVHAFPDWRMESCTASLRKKLSIQAFARIEPLLRMGLAVYIYYYPAAPVRANYWGGIPCQPLVEYLKRTFNEEAAISGWIRLTARLLYLGYLPYSVRNEGLGACMDFGNATLDGGFCDPDSIVPIGPDVDDEFFREGIIQSLSLLQKTVQLLLGLSDRPDLYPNIESFSSEQFIRHAFREALSSQNHGGLQLDPRVTELLHPRTLTDLKRVTRRRGRISWYGQYVKRAGGLQRPR